MKRNQVLSLLDKYEPITLLEKQMVVDTICFIRTNVNCFERSFLKGHVTASSWIVNEERTHVILMHHYKLNKWLQPGGHCDGDSDVMKVAMKEALEETGLIVQPIIFLIFDVDIHSIPERNEVPAHLHYDIRFLFQAKKETEILPNTHESKEVRWVEICKIFNYSNEKSILRMLEKLQLIHV